MNEERSVTAVAPNPKWATVEPKFWLNTCQNEKYAAQPKFSIKFGSRNRWNSAQQGFSYKKQSENYKMSNAKHHSVQDLFCCIYGVFFIVH